MANFERMSEISAGEVRNPGSASHPRVRFGLFEVDLWTCELRKRALRIRVPHQSFQILAMLLERPGQVITREQLRRALWPSDVFVDFERSLNSAVQKLRSALQDSAQQSRYIETLPKQGYRFIATVELVLSVSEPSQPAATEGPTELPSATKVSDELPAVMSWPRGRWKYWTMAVFVSVLLIAFVWHQYHRRNQPVPAQAHQLSVVIPSSARRRSVAVMGFRNASRNAQASWLSTAFTEMLATEMAAGNHLRTVAEEHVARAKLELSLADKDSYASDTLTKIHQNLGCDYVVVGSYLALGQAGKERVRLDARVQDAVTGETVASVAVTGSQSDLFDLASRAGEQLRAGLDVEALTLSESEGVRTALPATPEAARLYSEGLAKLRVFDDIAARDLLEKVIGSEPRYSPAYSALATAWFALGYDAKAAASARQAMDLAGGLPERLRLEVEARYHEMSGEWTQAAEVYLRLQRSYPDDLDYGLELATAQTTMGDSAAGAATIAALRKLPSPQRDDPRIDLSEAAVARELSDYKREQTLAQSAARKAEKAGARLLMARAELIEGRAFDSLGNFNSALEAYTIAQRIFAESGDLDQSAMALMDTGIVLLNTGDLAGAQNKIARAREVFRKKGDQANLAAALSNLGIIYLEQGKIPETERLYREALTIFNDIGRKNRQDDATDNLADVLRQQGKFREAKDMLEPLVEHLRSSGRKALLGVALDTLGLIAEAQGDMQAALQKYREAVSLCKDAGDKIYSEETEQLLGKAYLRQGDFESANRVLSEALSIDRDISAKGDAALAQIALVEVALEQARPSDSTTLRAALEELRLEKMTDGEIEGDIVLVRELIEQGKTAEAAELVNSAVVLSKGSYDPTVRFDVALATARLRVAQHRCADAGRTLRPALDQAIQVGCVSCQLEARLELGEIQIARGNRERGRSQLRDLADEAERRGFGLIAKRAAADSIGPAGCAR